MTSISPFNLKLLFFFLFILNSCSVFQSKNPYERSGELKENQPIHLKKPYVVLVSLDGFRHDYVEKFKPSFLQKLQETGTYATLNPIFPSKTFPNHYSIVTGMYPVKHGLVGNSFYDPDRNETYSIGNRKAVNDGSWYLGEPIWVAASKQGMVSASYFWVGSDANIQNTYPSYYYKFNKEASSQQKVEQLERWLNLPDETRPHFITLYFHQVDSQGHRFGPDSLETRKAVLEVDEALEKINQVIQSSNLPINLIITSDHGMKDVSSVDSIYLSDHTDLKDVQMIGKGALVYLYTKTYEQKNKILSDLKSLQTLSAYDRLKAPQRFAISNSDRAGDIILVAKPGYAIFKEPSLMNLKSPLGAHGYDVKESSDMKGVFFAKGPNIQSKGQINEFENIHVYPLIMDILGLKAHPEVDGKKEVLAPLLKN